VPTYVYRASGPVEKNLCEICRDGFEVVQPMAEEALKKCPECGEAVERVITAPNVRTGQSEKSMLSNENLKKHGFSKLVREDKGVYRKDV